ncbi:MAG TPA: MarC family protein [Victivallales bacterium]|nr:MarC family protein [Victivallales bacterium]HRR29278.1 MarC family protein [Victivallales bacterium]
MEYIQIKRIFIDTLSILAFINPISKVSLLSTFSSAVKNEQIPAKKLISRASITAGFILIGTMLFGDIILKEIFHVDMYSLSIVGGFVLSFVGFNALRKGIFFEKDTKDRFEDIALVPLACPMIAGPATITACVLLKTSAGVWSASISIAIAIIVNHIFMLLSSKITQFLSKYNILGALIRITGLIVMTIGVQMIIDGILLISEKFQ